MEWKIFEKGKEAGTLRGEEKGLFWNFTARLPDPSGPVRRVYVLSGASSVYLGIPDGTGCLKGRIPGKYLTRGITGGEADRQSRSKWCPWHGSLDHVEVREARICREGEQLLVAMPPREAARFPAWASLFEKTDLPGENTLCIALQPETLRPLKEKEGGQENETNDCPCTDPVLCSDLPAAPGPGSGGEEAHSPDPG